MMNKNLILFIILIWATQVFSLIPKNEHSIFNPDTNMNLIPQTHMRHHQTKKPFEYYKKYENYGTPARTSIITGKNNIQHITQYTHQPNLWGWRQPHLNNMQFQNAIKNLSKIMRKNQNLKLASKKSKKNLKSQKKNLSKLRMAKKGDFEYLKKYEKYGAPARTSTVSSRVNYPHISQHTTQPNVWAWANHYFSKRRNMRLNKKKGDFEYLKKYEKYGAPARTSTVSSRVNYPHISQHTTQPNVWAWANHYFSKRRNMRLNKKSGSQKSDKKGDDEEEPVYNNPPFEYFKRHEYGSPQRTTDVTDKANYPHITKYTRNQNLWGWTKHQYI